MRDIQLQSQEESFPQLPNHAFNQIFAERYGVHEAILIGYFQDCINTHKLNERNFKEGRTWTCQTRREIASYLHYFSENQVRIITAKLVKKGVLIKVYFNKSSSDRALSYAFVDEKMFTDVDLEFKKINKKEKGRNKNNRPAFKTI